MTDIASGPRRLHLPHTRFSYVVDGENSRLFSPEAVKVVTEIIKPELLHCIADAYHHVFLDQPLDFIEVLRGVLSRISEG